MRRDASIAGTATKHFVLIVAICLQCILCQLKVVQAELVRVIALSVSPSFFRTWLECRHPAIEKHALDAIYYDNYPYRNLCDV